MLRIIGYLLGVGLLFALLAIAGTLWIFWEYGRDLPDYNQLANYEPPVMTRVHAGDGRMLEEYAIQRRVFVPAQAIPRRVVEAFVAAEDKNFFYHPGIDPLGILRAALTNVRNMGSGRRPVGASTITQQVAQNFLLAKDLSYTRKIKEAILAFRIERAYTKDQILELYLNEIYLGRGAYGIAAAAINYFGRSLDELTVAEVAFLAALPKAPNNYDPVRRPAAARARRNYVLGRMVEDGFIQESDAQRARNTEIQVSRRDPAEWVDGGAYFAEAVRRELVERYGESALYEGGLSVRTTLNPHFQSIADNALTDGLLAYDRRHGWRGAVTTLPSFDAWPTQLANIELPTEYGNWRLAVALVVESDRVEIGLVDRTQGEIPLSELTWARPWQRGQRLGPKVTQADQVLGVGDVILVEPIEANTEGEDYPDGTFALRQVPEIQGAIIAMDPHTGRVLAMSGGFDFSQSEFNRATQAWRQPGSAFKPFVYMAALDAGFTPSTLILDAPFVIDQGPGLGKWKPANYTKNFYGPSPMRLGIEKSRNLMTVRLAQTVGMASIADYAERFGVVEDLPEQLSMSIGAGETTLLRLT
ncbi:MAG: penicillin-binding protein 1A, partial [Alphaproteobacteria bacterium]